MNPKRQSTMAWEHLINCLLEIFFPAGGEASSATTGGPGPTPNAVFGTTYQLLSRIVFPAGENIGSAATGGPTPSTGSKGIHQEMVSDKGCTGSRGVWNTHNNFANVALSRFGPGFLGAKHGTGGNGGTRRNGYNLPRPDASFWTFKNGFGGIGHAMNTSNTFPKAGTSGVGPWRFSNGFGGSGYAGNNRNIFPTKGTPGGSYGNFAGGHNFAYARTAFLGAGLTGVNHGFGGSGDSRKTGNIFSAAGTPGAGHWGFNRAIGRTAYAWNTDNSLPKGISGGFYGNIMSGQRISDEKHHHRRANTAPTSLPFGNNGSTCLPYPLTGHARAHSAPLYGARPCRGGWLDRPWISEAPLAPQKNILQAGDTEVEMPDLSSHMGPLFPLKDE